MSPHTTAGTNSELRSRSDQSDSVDLDRHCTSDEDGPQRRLQSCDLCRRKKIKCDGTKPQCEKCQKSGVDCHYSFTAVRRKTRKSALELLEERVTAMEGQLQPLVKQLTKVTDLLSHLPALQGGGAPAAPVASNASLHPGTAAAAYQSPPLDYSGTQSPMAPLPSSEPQPLSPLIYPFTASHRAAHSPSPAAPTDGTSELSPTAACQSQAVAVLDNPVFSDELRNEALQAYLRSSATYFFRALPSRFPDLFYPAKSPAHYINALCAIGCRFSAHPRLRQTPAYMSGHEFYLAAEAEVLTILTNPSLYGIATLLCLAMYSVGRGNYRKSWLYVGIANRMAHQLYLNRIDNPGSQYLNTGDDELTMNAKRRLFWLCYVVDKVCSSGCSQPHMLSDADCQVQLPPLSPLLQSLANESHMNQSAYITDRFTASDVCHYTIRVIGLHGTVSSFVNRRWQSGDGDVAEFHRLSTVLTRFMETLPQPLQCDPHSLPLTYSRDDNQLLTGFLQIHAVFHAAVIILYRSNLSHIGTARASSQALQDLSRQKCLTAARSMGAIIQAGMRRLEYEYFEPFIGIMVSHSALVFANCVLSSDHELRAEACQMLQVHEQFITSFGEFWMINQMWTAMVRGVMQRQIEQVDRSILTSGPSPQHLMSIRDLAERCRRHPGYCDQWVVPIRSHYTSESYFEFKHGNHLECRMISSAEAQLANGPDYTLLLAYLDANHRGGTAGDGIRVRPQVALSSQLEESPRKRPRCKPPNTETATLSMPPLSASESVPGKQSAMPTDAALLSSTGSTLSPLPSSSLAWPMDPSALGMNIFSQSTLGQLWADSSMQLPLMNMANVALDFSVPLLAADDANGTNTSTTRPDHQATTESQPMACNAPVNADPCSIVPTCIADNLPMTPAVQLPNSLITNSALGSWAQLTQPPPTGGVPSYTTSTAIPASNPGNSTTTAQPLTSGVNQLSDEELRVLLGRIIPSSSPRGASQPFPAI